MSISPTIEEPYNHEEDIVFNYIVNFQPTAAPKYTDYCQMLGRDIEGKQYSFIAGNKMYYIGG